MKLASTGGIFTFEIWDISGNEMFHNLANIYFRDADAIFLIFDCTKKESMRSLRENWVQEIKEKAPETVQLLVLGNKSDLNEEEGQVSTKELSEFANQCGARYKFVSAKTAENLSDVFQKLGDRLRKQPANMNDAHNNSFRLSKGAKRRSSKSKGGRCTCRIF
mmetsp:Transcript_37724/g.27806  ORF Transcript_37724/g.27806 Transcript_37724/m.27806 type:complete len:163 (-) Transcript_37724:33-521(-)